MGHNDRRVVMVTGANRGIGNTILRQLAVGMIVVLTARDEKQAETAASQLSKLGAASRSRVLSGW
jgi:short-subunit dehydrogenase